MKFTSALAVLSANLIASSYGQGDERSPSLIDPRTAITGNYTLPNQTFPGLQSNWNPRPDTGERTYVGRGRLRGRRALITGGDSGIGRAVAIAYAREGADIAINYLPEEESDAQEVAEVVRRAGRRIYLLPGDLRNETFCADLVRRAARSLGGSIDILANNAGYSRFQPSITNHSTEIFERTFRTNVFAPFFITRAAVPLMPPGSAIIFTASALAAPGNPAAVDYAATKAVGVSFTRSLAAQLASVGIRVNAVAPGAVMTNFLTSQGATNDRLQEMEPQLPFGRLAHPVELAPLFVGLAEGSNSYVSGSTYLAAGAAPIGAF